MEKRPYIIALLCLLAVAIFAVLFSLFLRFSYRKEIEKRQKQDAQRTSATGANELAKVKAQLALQAQELERMKAKRANRPAIRFFSEEANEDDAPLEDGKEGAPVAAVEDEEETIVPPAVEPNTEFSGATTAGFSSTTDYAGTTDAEK